MHIHLSYGLHHPHIESHSSQGSVLNGQELWLMRQRQTLEETHGHTLGLAAASRGLKR